MLCLAWRTSFGVHLFRLLAFLAVIHWALIAEGTKVYDLSATTTSLKPGNQSTRGAGPAAAVGPEKGDRWHEGEDSRQSHDDGNPLELPIVPTEQTAPQDYAIVAAAAPSLPDHGRLAIASSNPSHGNTPLHHEAQIPASSHPGPGKAAEAQAAAPSSKQRPTASGPLHFGRWTGVVEELTSLNSSEAAITSLIWRSVKSRVESTDRRAERLTLADGGPLPEAVMPDPSVANDMPAARIEVTLRN